MVVHGHRLVSLWNLNILPPNSKTVVSDTFVPARYVKLVITESHRPPFVSIGEVSIYGKVK